MSTVLVIDDEKGILQIIYQALTKFGHQVETAADGQEGIRKFDHGSFDIVITDIRMPGIDGNGVVNHIRKSEKQSVPVIAISGTPWQMENNAFDMVLAKPFALNKLVESIGSLVPVPPRAAVGA
ncbi:MAG: response regulator [Deltaproteobacteria bacterium]|jgi:CheY-like chemotaxis protein|nr:response regulator [Deltaproteobacteria bacterium]MBW2482724.1 response regulator [Deltaproteobacteria bacterium]